MSRTTARSLVQLQAELDKAFPGRVKPDWTLGDAAHRNRASDHNPNAAGVVCAIDVRGAGTARALWDHIRATQDGRVKYMIFDRQIVSSTVSPWTVRSYGGDNPHSDHIHISVGRGPSGSSGRPDLYDSSATWGLANASSPTPPPTGGTVNVPLPVLKRGSKGGSVRSLQTLLVTKAGQEISVDGDFGPATERAVRNVQAFFGLSVDGIVGGRTWPALFL